MSISESRDWIVPDVIAERCLVDNVECYTIKISAPFFELNVVMTPDEVARLAEVPSTPWLSGALAIGTSAGSAVWWSVDEGSAPHLSVLIGQDDQTWDVGFSLGLGTLDRIHRELACCAAPSS